MSIIPANQTIHELYFIFIVTCIKFNLSDADEYNIMSATSSNASLHPICFHPVFHALLLTIFVLSTFNIWFILLNTVSYLVFLWLLLFALLFHHDFVRYYSTFGFWLLLFSCISFRNKWKLFIRHALDLRFFKLISWISGSFSFSDRYGSRSIDDTLINKCLIIRVHNHFDLHF